MTETPGAPPDYLREIVDETRAFFTTLAGFARHPIKFSRAWADGEQHAMNPVAFFGACIGFRLLLGAVDDHFFAADEALDEAHKLAPVYFWFRELISSQEPLVRAAIFAGVAHWRLRKKGSPVPFRGSLGAVLFSYGVRELLHAAFLLVALAGARKVASEISSFVAVVTWAYLGASLVGVHRLKRWRAAAGPLTLAGVAVVLAMVAFTAPVWIEAIRAEKDGKDHDLMISIDSEGRIRTSRKPKTVK